jgi:hypothetical protein
MNGIGSILPQRWLPTFQNHQSAPSLIETFQNIQDLLKPQILCLHAIKWALLAGQVTAIGQFKARQQGFIPVEDIMVEKVGILV